jgi:hypothetical protein
MAQLGTHLLFNGDLLRILTNILEVSYDMKTKLLQGLIR